MQQLERLRLAVTRPASQAEELAMPLRALGATVLVAPLIRIAPAPVEGALLDAVRTVGSFDWLVFSSVNGVDLFVDAVAQAGEAATLQTPRVACVGPATAEAAQRHGLVVSAMPRQFVGDAIAEALLQHGQIAGARVLLARAGGARSVLPEQLRAAGAEVVDVEVYRSVPDEKGGGALRAAIESGALDLVTLTSGSAARNLVALCGSNCGVPVAVIGPVTATEARQAGLEIAVEASPHTTDGLVAAIVTYWSRNH